ncbi:uncharacterized protein [Nicotiana tomentosiformis]|uniref:uncharacterized protein n=1 Tax=Nicotiana tomentosiformis TaxID=4098 RepID=UPI00388CB4A6
MTEDKDITAQINEYHKLIEDLKSEEISLPEQFVAGKEIATRTNLMEDNKQQNKSNNRYDKRNGYKPKTNNQTFKKKGNCFVCGKPGYHAAQCRKRDGNDCPAKVKVNLTEAKADDIIAAVVFQVNLVANVKDWVLDSGATRHICANKKDFVSYIQIEEGEQVVYLGDSKTTPVLGKGKVLLKLTFGKTLALNDVLHVPSIRANLVFMELLGKVGVEGEAILSACHSQNRISYKKMGKTPYELWKGCYPPNLKYLKVWGYLAKVMLPDPKKRKIGSKTSDCMFIGYAESSAAYRFLVVKSDVLEHNTIVETKNTKFFENIFLLKFENIPDAPIISSDNISHVPIIQNDFESEALRRSKRSRKEKSFGNDFYTYLVDNDPLTYSETISSSDASFWKEAIDV